MRASGVSCGGRRGGCATRRSLSRRIHIRDVIRGGHVLLSVLVVIQLIVVEVFLAVSLFLLLRLLHLGVFLLLLLVRVHIFRPAGEPTRATGRRRARSGGSPRRRRGTRWGLVHTRVEEILDGIQGGEGLDQDDVGGVILQLRSLARGSAQAKLEGAGEDAEPVSRPRARCAASGTGRCSGTRTLRTGAQLHG